MLSDVEKGNNLMLKKATIWC